MPVDSTSSSTNAAMDYSTLMNSSTAPREAKKSLGQQDFLKLLAVQFQTQDPMKPMEDTAFIAQMAQFTSLEQASATTAQMTLLKNGQDIVTANSYIGHQLTFDLGKGQTASGQVQGVEITDGVPRLVVGNQTYPLSSVLLVEPAPTPPPATTPATS